MTRLIYKIKTSLLNKSGELLFESVASILVFSILFIGIVAMLQFSFRVTMDGNEDNKKKQESLNRAIVGDYDEDNFGTVGTLSLVGDGVDVGFDVIIYIDKENPFTAFKMD